ncbi:MAG: HAMP domain-containing protein [Deltaproteobacteria bacterium]|nr:HAMP domain-containing protein [Deltaproteobacteria bacterium]
MKLGIRSKLFLVSVGLITLSVVVADAYLTRALDADLTERIRQDLVVRLRLIERDASSFGASLEDGPAWDQLADDLGRCGEGRVTIIRRDGVVLGDSEVDGAELASVENHTDRPEVVDALARGEGSSARWSSTVHRRMMYAAVPFQKEGRTAGVARLAKPLTEVDEAIGRLRRLVLLASTLALGVAILMASLAALWMSRTIRDLTAAARRMAGGDLDTRTRIVGQDEIGELGRALDQLAAGLQTALGEVRTERDRMSRVLQGMREGVLLLDAEGRAALANPALREMLLLGADVVGRTQLEIVRDAELKHLLDDAARSDEAVSRELDLGELKPRRLLVHAARLPDEPGGLLAVFVDVTDIRRLESLRRDFVANVSHELRTPVAAVRSAAETLRRVAETEPEAAAGFIEMIERNSERLQRLIEDLLDLSRIEAKEYRLNLEAVDVPAVAGHIVSLFRAKAEAKRMRLAVEVPNGIRPARADRRAIEQVLSNLVDNAVKYGSDGAAVTVRAALDADILRVSVEDSGPGIEQRHLSRLFERFYRVDAGRSRELGGTGLGLSIVKHLVEAMGGTVFVASAPGEGTKFSFTLPAA